MKLLSIVIPVFNEEQFVEQLINQVLQVDLSELGFEKELVIVDDHSIDHTPLILAKYRSNPAIVFCRHEKNSGKGAALRTGFANANGDVVLIQDADLEYNPQEYAKMLTLIVEDKADVVYGSRFLFRDPRRIMSFSHYLGNKFLTFCSNVFCNLNFTDMETCYKLFRSDIIKKLTLQENSFGIEPEITAKLAKLVKKHGYRIYEVSISYNGRTYQEGKKIGVKDGIRALYCILKYNLISR